jgi:hypothetical protein
MYIKECKAIRKDVKVMLNADEQHTGSVIPRTQCGTSRGAILYRRLQNHQRLLHMLVAGTLCGLFYQEETVLQIGVLISTTF